jgi:hypothetical protein
MTHECQLLNRPPQPTLSVRTRSSVQALPQVLGPAWGAIMQYAGRLGVQPSGPPFVAYHNMDMQDLDLEIGFPFAQQLKGEGETGVLKERANYPRAGPPNDSVPPTRQGATLAPRPRLT